MERISGIVADKHHIERTLDIEFLDGNKLKRMTLNYGCTHCKLRPPFGVSLIQSGDKTKLLSYICWHFCAHFNTTCQIATSKD